MFVSMQKHGEQRHKKDWLAWVVQVCNINKISDDIVRQSLDMSEDLVGNLFTTRAAVAFLATSVDIGRNKDIGIACCEYLMESLRRVLGAPTVPRRFQVGQVLVEIDRYGRACFLHDALGSMSRLTLRAFARLWNRLHSIGRIGEHFDQTSLHIEDVFHVLLFGLKERRSLSKHKLSTVVLSSLNVVKESLVEWLALSIDTYIKDVYANLHDTNAPPTALVNEHRPHACRNRYFM